MAISQLKIQEMIEALELAIGTGASSISIDGRTVAYNSVQDMISAVQYLQQKLDGYTVKNPTIRRVNLGFSD